MSFKGFVKTPLPSTTADGANAGQTWTAFGNIGNMYSPASGGGTYIGRYVTPPSTPYTIIAHFAVNPTTSTALIRGPGLGFADGTKSIIMQTKAHANTYTSGYSVEYFSNTVTLSSTLAGYVYAYGFPLINIGWQAIRNDGTNIYFYIGDDSGQNFYQIYSEAKGANLGTINRVGIYSNIDASIRDWVCDSFRVIGA